MLPNLLYQGAEAKILLNEKENLITKERVPKSYRIKELDEKIIKHRTKSEKKLLEKASKIINAPNPLPLKEFNIIEMPYIKGKKLSEHLDNFPLEKQKEILKVVGQETSKLHDNDIIHGDLTTSNLILVEGKNDNERNDEVNDNERLINNKQRDKSSTLTILKRSIMTKSDAKQSIIYFLDFGLGFISKKSRR